MKKIILIPVIALMMFSCKTDKQNELAANDNMKETIATMQRQLEQQKIELAKQNTIDSMQMVSDLRMPVAFAPAAEPKVIRKVVYVKQPKRNSPASAPVADPAPTVTQPIAESPAPVETTTTPDVIPAQKKKGWSNTAKGAVIGAGVGAIGGAVISKNHRVKGAVIGGLIGAAAGAGTGVILDRKKKQTEWQ